MTGNIGRPGTGANSITGQCNAMGSRLFSNTTNLLGGRAFENPQHREKVAGILGIDQERIPSQPSWSYDRIIEGILRGPDQGLWIIATNTAHSWINQHGRPRHPKPARFFSRAGHVHTTNRRSSHIWCCRQRAGEKRRDLHQLGAADWGHQKSSPSPGQALADFHIFR